MKGLFVVAVAALATIVALPVLAEPWTISVDAGLMLTENAYSDNWAGDEAGALSWAFNSNFLAEKQLQARIHNKNTLKLSFGQTRNQDKETKEWAEPVKSTDLIDLESIFRFTFGLWADPFAAGRVETQFLDASDPGKNRFLNPVTITESCGLARVLIKEEKREWAARFGVAIRQHLDRDVLVDSLANVRESQLSNDGGLEFVTDFNTHLADDRITYAGKLTVFRALFYSESEELTGQPNEDYWKSPDVNWENIFTGSITNYLMVNLCVQLLYDKEIDPGARFKQTLSLGLTYKLI